MRILTRTCIAEMLRLFIFYAVTYSLLAAIAVSAPLLNKGAPLGSVFTLLPLQLAFFSPYIIPLALCTAVLNLFGRMEDDGEFIALRAVGMSTWHVVRSLAPLILVIAILTSLMQHFLLPNAALHIREGKSDLVRQGIATKINRGEPIWENRTTGRKILAQEGNGEHLQHVIFYDHADGRQRFTYAPTSQWAFDDELRLSCRNVRYLDIQKYPDKKNRVITASIPQLTQSIPAENKTQQHRSKPDVKNLSAIEDAIREDTANIARMTAKADYDIHHYPLRVAQKSLRSHQLVWHMRMASPFAIFSYFILACAMALWLRIRNRLVASALGIGIIVLHIFPGVMAVKGTGGYLHFTPGILVWAPLILTSSIGSFLIWKKQ